MCPPVRRAVSGLLLGAPSLRTEREETGLLPLRAFQSEEERQE